MALLLAMMRTLVDEGFEDAALMARLNTQIARHAPRSRFVTLIILTITPATGEVVWVNAGHMPAIVRRANGRFERLASSGIALGMSEGSSYQAGRLLLGSGDVIALYSDGITEAENPEGHPFDEEGLERVIDSGRWASAKELGWEVFAAVEHYVRERRLLDDLTVLVARRLPPLPA
jgi:sigma-B regulation protein RsbU (phosphoserine phosphatase)